MKQREETTSTELSYESSRWSAAIVIFLWTHLLVLSSVGNSQELERAEGGFLLVSGLTVAGIAGFGLFALSKIVSQRLIVFAALGCLAVAPQVSLSTAPSDRTLYLELYFVLLLSIPAFLSFWRSWWQFAASVVVLGCAASLWMREGASSTPHSVFLVLLTAVLSVFMLIYREQNQRLEGFVASFFEEDRVRTQQLQEQTWSVLFLQAALLLLLLFLDIAVFQAPEQPLTCKLYALVILVLGGMMVSSCRPERLGPALLLVTLLVSSFVSLARMGYGESTNFYLVLPNLYLIVLAATVPWAWRERLALLAGVPLLDLSIKLLGVTAVHGASIESVGFGVDSFHQELGLTFLVSVIAFVVSVFRARHRQQSGRLNYDSGSVRLENTQVTSTESPIAWSSTLTKSIANRHEQRLVQALFVVGIISSLASARLLAILSAELWYVNVLSWLMFIVLWGTLLLGTSRGLQALQIWALGVFVALVLILWPSVLLIVSADSGLLWLFWPLAVAICIGSVPWRMRELIALQLVFAIVGVEIVRQLNLGLLGLSGLIILMLGSALIHVRSLRRMNEQEIITTFVEQSDQVQDYAELLRLTAEYAALACRSSGALCLTEDRNEILRQTWIYPLPFESTLREQIWQNVPVEVVGTEFAEVISKTFQLPERAGGLLGHSELEISAFFLRFQLEVVGLASIQPQESPPLRLAVGIPLQGPVPTGLRNQERRVLQVLSRMALGRFRALLLEKQYRELQEEHERRNAQREYELGALVHDINNTVQDLTLLCENILEDTATEGTILSLDNLEPRIRRIEGIARSVATVVSDAKRKRELERMIDFRPRELVEVGDVLAELSEFARLRAERKRISVAPFVVPGEQLWVKVSVREHLETIVRNLLHNAVAYSQPGTAIQVHVRYDASMVQIDVQDNGAGLSPDEVEGIFEVGVRGRSAHDVRGGLGLGLAVSRRVAESAGGSLSVVSSGLGKGSTFTLSLPRQSPPAIESPDNRWALVVDDEPPIVDFYERLARGLELIPRATNSVEGALSLLETHGAPTLAITDVHLGASDGLELVVHLRNVFGTSLPILVISGLPGDEVAARARAAGATDFVQKPVSRRSLFARIQSLLAS